MSSQLSLKLSKSERARLSEITDALGVHSDGFWAVFDLLSEVRNEKLYREDFPTFEDYCKSVLGFSRQYANRMIAAREVMRDFSSPDFGNDLVSKKAAIALTKIDPKVRPAIMEDLKSAAKNGEKITEKAVKAAETAWTEVDPPELKTDDDDDEEIVSKPKQTRAELAVENASIIKKIQRALLEVIKSIQEIGTEPGLELLEAHSLSIVRELQSARASIAVTIPHSVCPRCSGKRCVQCGNHGWINAVLAKELAS